MDTPLSYIVIPTCGRTFFLERTLQSLVSSDFGSFSVTVLVVENGAYDNAKAVTEKFSSSLNLKYKYFEKPSKSEAINFALKGIDKNFVIFFDNDIIVQPNTVNDYIQAAMIHGEGHYFGGPTSCVYEEPLSEKYAPFACVSIKGIEAGLDRGDHQLFLGHNWACFAMDFWRVGGYNHFLGPGKYSWVTVGDEDEIMSRLARKCNCIPVFLPSCRVFHHVDKEKVNKRWISAQRRRNGMSLLYRSQLDDYGNRKVPDFPFCLINSTFFSFLSCVKNYVFAVMLRKPEKLKLYFSCHEAFGKFFATILFRWLKWKQSSGVAPRQLIE